MKSMKSMNSLAKALPRFLPSTQRYEAQAPMDGSLCITFVLVEDDKPKYQSWNGDFSDEYCGRRGEVRVFGCTLFGDLKGVAMAMFPLDCGVSDVRLFRQRSREEVFLGQEESVGGWIRHGEVLLVKPVYSDSTTCSPYTADPFEELYSDFFSQTQTETETESETPAKMSAEAEWQVLQQKPPANLGGHLIAQGTISQYYVPYGASACSSICLLAACKLLDNSKSNKRKDWAEIEGRDLDHWVHLGIEAHDEHTQSQSNSSQQHASVDELWAQPPFSTRVAKFQRGDPLTGVLTESHALLQALQGAREFTRKRDCMHMAALLTKAPETVLLLYRLHPHPTTVGEEEWYLLDSHGMHHEATKRVYFLKFSSTLALADALKLKFPVENGVGGGGWQAEMYHMFELHPMVPIHQHNDAAHCAGNAGLLSVPSASSSEEDELTLALAMSQQEAHDTFQNQQLKQQSFSAQKQHSFASMPLENTKIAKVASPTMVQMAPFPDNGNEPVINAPFKSIPQQTQPNKPPPPPPPTASNNQTPPPYFSMDDYLDPIFSYVMADPVNCDDGYTYERTTIEKHFQTRREAEEARLAEEANDNENDNGNSNNDDTCCGARREILLTSPQTNAVVSANLVPNRTLEQQIVRLVQAQALDMTDEDLQDWHQRRQEKTRRDAEREERKKQAQLQREERRRNAELAEQRRALEAQQHPHLQSLPQSQQHAFAQQQGANQEEPPPCTLVRVDRRITQNTNTNNALSKQDLGLSVSLCHPSFHMTYDYLSNSQTTTTTMTRCTVACCARRIGIQGCAFSHCTRCGRYVCQSCLEFAVTSLGEEGNPYQLYNVCAECVMQVVDVMRSSGEEGQVRAILIKVTLAKYMDGLTQRAAQMQEEVVRWDAESEFGPGLQELSLDLQRLQRVKREIEEQTRQARERADQMRQQEGHAGEEESLKWELERLQEECEDLYRQYNQLVEKEVPQDEEGQANHVTALSHVTNQLEMKQMELMEAQSRFSEMQMQAQSISADGEGGTLEELEKTCAELVQRHEELTSKSIPQEEEEQMAHFTALSEVSARLETSQLRLVELRSSLTEQTPSAAATTGGDNDQTKARLKKPAISERLKGLSTRHLAPSDRFQLLIQKLTEEMTTKACPSNRKKKKFSLFRKQPPPQKDSPTEDSVDPSMTHALSQLDRSHSILMERRLAYEESMAGNDGTGQNEEDSRKLRSDLVEKVCETLDLLGNDAFKVEEFSEEVQQLYYMMKEELTREREELLVMIANPPPPTPLVTEAAPAATALSPPVKTQSPRDDLVKECLRLRAVDTRVMSEEECVAHLMNLSEVEGRLQSAEQELLSKKTPDDIQEVDHLRKDLEAIGLRDEDWSLPLGLSYPTQRMDHQLEKLRNDLKLHLSQSQRKLDDEYTTKRQDLLRQRDELEDEIARARSEAQDAQDCAEAEQQRLQERMERKRQEEAARRQRERARLERERQAREEQARLDRQHAAEEEATRAAFASAAGNEGTARAFGGRGDLRMCGRCKAGPIENMACTDLEQHNNDSVDYKGDTVESKLRPNHCPHCDWFDKDWHNWPLWDGIPGPH